MYVNAVAATASNAIGNYSCLRSGAVGILHAARVNSIMRKHLVPVMMAVYD